MTGASLTVALWMAVFILAAQVLGAAWAMFFKEQRPSHRVIDAIVASTSAFAAWGVWGVLIGGAP